MISKGYSIIFNFPFRIYASEDLPELYTATREGRIRVYQPISRNIVGSIIQKNIPFELWPDFEWNPSVPQMKRKPLPDEFGMSMWTNTKTYDGLRINGWGENSEKKIRVFYNNFLNWLRHLSGQCWINNYEIQYDSSPQNIFEIDARGRAIGDIIGALGFTVPASFVKPITVEIWKSAFENASNNKEVNSYWLLFHDAQHSFPRDNISETVLLMIISLEIAKNVNYIRFAKVKKSDDKTTTFEQPFDNVNLLVNLTTNVEKAISRNLKKEMPEVYLHIEQLYTARHHIAHGKKAVYLHNGKMQHVEKKIASQWLESVRKAIIWVESLNEAQK